MTPSEPLGPAMVLQGVADALPTHAEGDTTSHLSSSLDCVAIFVHACLVNLGFRLLGFHEDKNIELQCASLAPRLPSEWNNSLSSHGFVYAHNQSAMRFVIHVDRLGGKIEIRGLATGDERIARFDITARDFVSSSALPLRIPKSDSGEEQRGELVQKLSSLFISEERIRDLASLVKISLIQRLLPSLNKEGYTETRPEPAPRRISPPRPGNGNNPPNEPSYLPPPAAPHPYPAPDPLALPPRHPIPTADFPPPDFEDEYEVNRPPRGPGHGQGGAGFGSIGHDDLYPAGLGPHDPIRGSFTPGGGIGPGGLRRPGGGGGGFGGMHPTFDDPLFRGPGGRGGRGGGDGDGDGDDTFGGQIPPGARWDPLGPGGQPRFGGGGRGRGFGGGFGGFGSGDII
ncbi:PI31 proteasome regulator N-terminal-domain-containing protein [Dichotomopilus funicola]|uniref:PI31 proteasome regulator N-terminal-domain-containing protein n=1 Tax=Dichotomopilus funicola TaxID=1934379 RepID=A0AAN6ZNU3_9PEZI|nr:PI31 proteasome regulator N-terminal-domain-containing protein [Dichotomopilus funicola]